MKLIDANRDAGVMMVTVDCECGNRITWHSDADMVACQGCGRRAVWRWGDWAKEHLELVRGVPRIGEAQNGEEKWRRDAGADRREDELRLGPRADDAAVPGGGGQSPGEPAPGGRGEDAAPDASHRGND